MLESDKDDSDEGTDELEGIISDTKSANDDVIIETEEPVLVNSDGDEGNLTSSSRTEASETSSSTVSLLSILKAPTRSELSRKRLMARNPPRGKRKCRGKSIHDPTNIKPTQRIKEYPNEPFTVSKNKLFCKGCREELCIKKSSLKNHIASSKHVKGKEMLKQKMAKEQDLAISLKQYNSMEHLRGETLPESQQVYHVKVIKAFLQAGVPLTKIDVFRELLEENGYHLTHRCYLFDLIPFIVNEEEAQIKKMK